MYAYTNSHAVEITTATTLRRRQASSPIGNMAGVAVAAAASQQHRRPPHIHGTRGKDSGHRHGRDAVVARAVAQVMQSWTALTATFVSIAKASIIQEATGARVKPAPLPMDKTTDAHLVTLARMRHDAFGPLFSSSAYRYTARNPNTVEAAPPDAEHTLLSSFIDWFFSTVTPELAHVIDALLFHGPSAVCAAMNITGGNGDDGGRAMWKTVTHFCDSLHNIRVYVMGVAGALRIIAAAVPMSAAGTKPSRSGPCHNLQEQLLERLHQVVRFSLFDRAPPSFHIILRLYFEVHFSAYMRSLVREGRVAEGMYSSLCERDAYDPTSAMDVAEEEDAALLRLCWARGCGALRELGLLPVVENCFSEVLFGRTQNVVEEECREVFDERMLAPVVFSFVDEIVVPFLRNVLVPSGERGADHPDGALDVAVSDSDEETAAAATGGVGGPVLVEYMEPFVQWKSRLQFFAHERFAQLRIDELFNILVEFPDSRPALEDLKECIEHTGQLPELVRSLKAAFTSRLLQPGANTADILTQYINTVGALRLLDPSGVTLEKVGEPVSKYLRQRGDTVRCIVGALVGHIPRAASSNQNAMTDQDVAVAGAEDPLAHLHQELRGVLEGEAVDVDEGSEDEDDAERGDEWQPDPIHANVEWSSVNRKRADIIALLVNIYGSKDPFVAVYRDLLAERLLQSANYETDAEVTHLELFKLRFGETNLRNCEVMVRDISESKRVNSGMTERIGQVLGHGPQQQQGNAVTRVDATILSGEFWPELEEEELKLPDAVEAQLGAYATAFSAMKAPRKLEWQRNLGQVEITIELRDRKLDMSVSPVHATILSHFEARSVWTLSEISGVMGIEPENCAKYMKFWTSRKVLQETRSSGSDEGELCYELLEVLSDSVAVPSAQDMDDGEFAPVALSSARQGAADIALFESFILGMLGNNQKLSSTRLQNLLVSFDTQGFAYNKSEEELQVFLERLVVSGRLQCHAGLYERVVKD